MFKKSVFLFFLCALLFSQEAYAEKVGLLITATGRYIEFVPPLIESARKHFLNGHEVTFFVFTDGHLPEAKDVVQIYQERLGWPYDTLKRYHVYQKSKSLLKNETYLFALDADMLFVDTVGEEILGKRVATLHPGFIGRRGTYETSPLSTSCVKKTEGAHYFAGGFYGGITQEVFKIFTRNIKNIEKDLSKNFIAIWHDESHWNRYCIDFPPTLLLSPSYCYPESWDLPYKKKLLALDKDHAAFRAPTPIP